MDITIEKYLFEIRKQRQSVWEYPPIVRPHATVDHAYVLSDGLHFMDTLLIIQNGLLFLLCCQDNSIGSWNSMRIPQLLSTQIHKMLLTYRINYSVILLISILSFAFKVKNSLVVTTATFKFTSHCHLHLAFNPSQRKLLQSSDTVRNHLHLISV